MWDHILGQVKEHLPRFNDFLLIDYRKNEINKSAEYIETVYKEAVKLFDEQLQYVQYRKLSPEERITFQLNSKWQSGQIDIRISELELFEYTFLFHNKEYYIYLYLPYSHHNAIVLSDISYYMLLAIVERVIYHIDNGINIKVMRSPLHFWRFTSPTYSSTNGQIFMDPLITIKAHSKPVNKSRSGPKTSVILYLLTQYGLNGLLNRFDFPETSIVFTEYDLYNESRNIETSQYRVHIENLNINYDTSKYLSVKLKDFTYLNMHIDQTKNKYFRRIVISIINAFKSLKKCDINSIYICTNTNGLIEYPFWQFVLGKCIYGNKITKDALLINHVKNHLKSLSTYLDPITLLQLDKLGIYCHNIYDLFIEVFLHLDDWLINKSVTNLYEKRVGVLDLVLAEITKKIFKHFYDIEQKHQPLTEQNIMKLLKINSKVINNIYVCDVLHSSPSQYNDNALIGILSKKSRQPANQNSKKKQVQENILNSPDHRFDVTFNGVESLYNVPTSNPGIGGSINPFAIIDEEGCLLKPDWTVCLDELIPYLPRS